MDDILKRIDSRWSEYSPGVILEVALMQRLLDDPKIAEFDRMRGIEPYKLRTSNGVIAASQLRGWSSLPVRAADQGWRGFKRRVKGSTRIRAAWARSRRSRLMVSERT